MDRPITVDQWFIHQFLYYTPLSRPILLIMDDHSSHYCPDTIHLAALDQVILFTLPPNTTHLTQPLDKGMFRPLKVSWSKVCHSFLAKHPGRVITRYDFSALFSDTWMNAMTVKNILSGFKVTGIYPLDRNAIKESLAKKSGLAFIQPYTPSERKYPILHLQFVFPMKSLSGVKNQVCCRMRVDVDTGSFLKQLVAF